MAYRWLLIVLLIAQTAAAQNYIEGRVVSAEEESPLVDASVFLNNTTIGTITGSNGYFKLSGIPSGSYELVVSMIGYHKYVKSIILDENTEYILDIKLTAQPTVLQELTIIPNNTETWEKWGLLFTETFIGLTPNAEKTKIKNTKDIRFIYSNQKLEAYAVKPLRIENNALGYKIEYHLEEFEIDFKAKTSYYAGFPRFIEPRTVKTKHKRERENAYDASLLKFIRMVYKNQLVKDGYIVRKMEFKPNLERQRVDSLYNSFMKTEVNADGTMRGSFLPDPIYTEDSLSYFREIRKQPKEVAFLHTDTLKVADFTLKEQDSFFLKFDNFLWVINTSSKEDPAYLTHTREVRHPVSQTSMMTLTDLKVEIFENGHYSPPNGIMVGEYWGWSNKVADLLPLDYIPDLK